MYSKVYKILIIPYALLMIYLMLFGFGRTQYDDHIVRLNPITSTIIFVKHNLLWQNYKNIIINILGNIVMFVPFGFLGLLVPKYNELKVLLMSFLSVLLVVEAVQYFTKMGVFDIDDVLLNTLGVMLGFWIFKIFKQRL